MSADMVARGLASRTRVDVGLRAVISPMIADRTFYQAIPGLLDAFPAELRPLAEAMRTASAFSTGSTPG